MTFFLLTLVKSSIVLAGAAAITAMLRRASAATRHMVWTCALLTVLALPIVSIALPAWNIPLMTVRAPAEMGSSPIKAPDAPDHAVAAMAKPSTAGPQPIASATTASLDPVPWWRALHWTRAAAILWGAGALALLLRLLAGSLAVQVLARRTASAEDAAWSALGREIAERHAIRRVHFRSGPAAAMPVTWGIVRPVVVMPQDAETWPVDRLRVALIHELAHVKRADCLTHVLSQAALAIHWINPLAWMAVRRAQAERERACDDIVLANGTQDVHYADQLLEIARAMGRRRFAAAAASLAMAHRTQLEGRLMAILDRSIPRNPVSRTRLILTAIVAGMAILGLGSIQPWVFAASNAPAALQPASRNKPAKVAQTAPPEKPAVGSAVQKRRETVPAPASTPSEIAEAVAAGVAEAAAEGALTAAVEGIPEAVEAAVAQVKPSLTPKKAAGKKTSRPADPKIIAALTAALKDESDDVRRTALMSLVQLDAPGLFEPLAAALKDPSEDVRSMAALGLGQSGDERAIDLLMAALKDSSADVRKHAALALTQLAR